MTTRSLLAEKRNPVSHSVGVPARRLPITAQQALHRAVAGGRGLRPAEVLHLQRTIGNRAVAALLTVGAPSIQRGKWWTEQADAVTWVQTNPVDKIKHTTAAKYYNALKTALGRTADVDDLVWVKAAADAFWLKSRENRKPLSASGWQHIWRGDVGSRGYPSGFHWKGKAGDAYCEGYDDASVADAKGFYKQAVQYKQAIAEAGTGGASMGKRYKADASTFFPDDWTEQEVKDAIELRNSQDEITKPAKGLGVKLAKAGDTIYPSI